VKTFRDLDRREGGFDRVGPRIPTGTGTDRHGSDRAIFGVEYRLNDAQFGLGEGFDLLVAEARDVALFVETRVQNRNLLLARVL
jgi:hypothetical protein